MTVLHILITVLDKTHNIIIGFRTLIDIRLILGSLTWNWDLQLVSEPHNFESIIKNKTFFGDCSSKNKDFWPKIRFVRPKSKFLGHLIKNLGHLLGQIIISSYTARTQLGRSLIGSATARLKLDRLVTIFPDQICGRESDLRPSSDRDSSASPFYDRDPPLSAVNSPSAASFSRESSLNPSFNHYQPIHSRYLLIAAENLQAVTDKPKEHPRSADNHHYRPSIDR